MAQLEYKKTKPGAPSGTTTIVIEGLAALSLIKDEGFRREWATLSASCPWATNFQGHEFVTVWYRVYGDQYDPVIVRQTNAALALTGLLPLARERSTGKLVVAGAHQAEYHTWLALPDCGDTFVVQALDLLRRENPRGDLTFKFLPPGTPTKWLDEPSRWHGLAQMRQHKRPLLAFGNGDSIAASLKKKGNVSRLNRLKRLGELEFKEIKTPSEFDSIIDQIAEHYDLRQGAVNGSTPFGDDPLKKTFLRELMKCDGVLHVSALMLNGAPVAAVIANREKEAVSIGVFSHSPFQAKHSPGKFHLLFLGEFLAQRGFTSLDLTPGGQWKDRFATTSDEVLEVILHFSGTAARRARAVVSMEALISRLCKRIGIRPDHVRSLQAKIGRISDADVMQRLKRWLWHKQEFRLYVCDAQTAAAIDAPQTMCVNRLSQVLSFSPSENHQTRDEFLSQALHRLEAGDRIFTMSEDDQLVHYGWAGNHVTESYFPEIDQHFQYPPGSAVLYDFYTVPAARGRGLYQKSLKQTLRAMAGMEGTEHIFISVLADNAESRHVIEKLGFHHVTSLYKSIHFGIPRRWSDPQTIPPQTVNNEASS